MTHEGCLFRLWHVFKNVNELVVSLCECTSVCVAFKDIGGWINDDLVVKYHYTSFNLSINRMYFVLPDCCLLSSPDQG